MARRGIVLGLAAALATVAPAVAQDGPAGPEVGVGLLDHAVRKFFRHPPAPGTFYDSEAERGTVDVQVVYRAAPVARVLGARPNARLQVSTGGRTSFAAVGAEWRQHAPGDRLYGQIGIGLAVHDGYRHVPDPSEPGLAAGEAGRRRRLYQDRTSFGSRVLFNPNASVGVRLDGRWALEAAWEHFSHKRLLARQNPGIDTVGVRLVRGLGRH